MCLYTIVRMQVNPIEYGTAVNCFKKTIGEEGVYSLWKGSSPAFSGALLENVINLSI